MNLLFNNFDQGCNFKKYFSPHDANAEFIVNKDKYYFTQLIKIEIFKYFTPHAE